MTNLRIRRSAVVSPLLLLAALATPAAGADGPSAGSIVGHLDGISYDGQIAFLSGWACQRGERASIAVHVYVDDGTAAATRSFLTAGEANLANEPAVDSACGDAPNGAHRFVVVLPPSRAGSAAGSRTYVDGIRVRGGVPNAPIAGSGEPLTTLGEPVTFPAVRALAGTYRVDDAHPRVFATHADLDALAARIDRPQSYSHARFAGLAATVRHDVAAHVDWDATYAGCRLKTYLFAFSYEPPEAGFSSTLRADVAPAAGLDPPGGAAVVAARAALYASLVRAGASVPPGGPSADAAVTLARRILLAWTDRGFRARGGAYRTLADFDCDDDGKPFARANAATGLGLALGRGVVYSADAQDLLEGLGQLDHAQVRRADAFHAALATLIRQSANTAAGTYEPACVRFSNLQANALAGLLAIARLRGDEPAFDAALSGGDANRPVLVPWTALFERAIYGRADVPNACFDNTGPDATTSRPSFQTAIVAPGEIDDRFRNANPSQGIGYPMFTLERLIDTAEILRLAGYRPYDYRGGHGQSIASVIAYYDCLAAAAGFRATIAPATAAACPDGAQYVGKIVNGVEPMTLFGAARSLTAAGDAGLERRAKASAATGPFAADPLTFGRWSD